MLSGPRTSVHQRHSSPSPKRRQESYANERLAATAQSNGQGSPTLHRRTLSNAHTYGARMTENNAPIRKQPSFRNGPQTEARQRLAPPQTPVPPPPPPPQKTQTQQPTVEGSVSDVRLKNLARGKESLSVSGCLEVNVRI